MSRRTKTLVPIATNLLYPEVTDGVTEKIHQKCQKAKSYHDKNAKELPDLDIGREMHIAPTHRGKTWEAGTCLQKLSDMSYMYVVETSGGEVLRHNRQTIKPSQSEHVAEQDSPKAESAVPQTSTLSASTDLAANTTAPAARTSSRTSLHTSPTNVDTRFQDFPGVHILSSAQ